jgi:hypothetical protein
MRAGDMHDDERKELSNNRDKDIAIAGKILQSPDRYEHDGPHRPISVALGAVIGYWYGQPDWRTRGGYEDPSNVPPTAIYSLDRLDDCCTEYGFRKGYRFRGNDYSDSQTDEEIRRYEARDRERHCHNPLAVARGTVLGYVYGRAGNVKPWKVPADLISSCCAGYGYEEGFRAGNLIFFYYATEAEKAQYLEAKRIEQNRYGGY